MNRSQLVILAVLWPIVTAIANLFMQDELWQLRTVASVCALWSMIYVVSIWQIGNDENSLQGGQWYGALPIHFLLTALIVLIALFFYFAQPSVSLAWRRILWVAIVAVAGQWLALMALSEKRNSNQNTS